MVVESMAAGLTGLEPISGIPGSVGARPVQNVGAFGVLTQDVLKSVDVYDRQTKRVEMWGFERCGFDSHRQSAFKHTDRYVVRARLQTLPTHTLAVSFGDPDLVTAAPPPLEWD